jgi:hypothetical protein
MIQYFIFEKMSDDGECGFTIILSEPGSGVSPVDE